MTTIEYGADLTGTAEPTPTQTQTEVQPVTMEYLDYDGNLVRFHGHGVGFEGFILGASRVDVYEIVPSSEPGKPPESVRLTYEAMDFLQARYFVDREARKRFSRLGAHATHAA